MSARDPGPQAAAGCRGGPGPGIVAAEHFGGKIISMRAMAMILSAVGPWPGVLPAQVTDYLLICDLAGQPAEMRMAVQTLATSDPTFGTGGAITGLIPTGEVSVHTAGTIISAVAAYQFTGQNDFATVTGMGETFVVQWVPDQGGLWMIVNPMAEPARQGRHYCRLAPG
jgi:hypothetical protein